MTAGALAGLRALSRIAADLTDGPPSSDVVQRISDDLASPLGVDFAIRYGVEGGADRLRLRTTTGVPSRHLPTLETVVIGEAVCGMVAAERRASVHSHVDIRSDARLALAQELDATAYASFPLLVHRVVIGTVSFGSRCKASFSEEELHVLRLAAGIVTAASEREWLVRALVSARLGSRQAEDRAHHLSVALESNRVIATAAGIVMVRRGLTRDAAMHLLAQASQHRNRKLRDLAEQIVWTGELPDDVR
jgi:GAF domain-containing protein